MTISEVTKPDLSRKCEFLTIYEIQQDRVINTRVASGGSFKYAQLEARWGRDTLKRRE